MLSPRIIAHWFFMGLLSLVAMRAAESDVAASARQQADSLMATVMAAAAPAPREGVAAPDPLRSSLGPNMADYANNPGADSQGHESFIEAARRIVASGTPDTRRAPDATSLWLDETAGALLGTVRAADAAGLSGEASADLRARALLARFHARRMLAAVHYNLFKRSLRLAELVAATYGEKDAVIVWRELVATLPDHPLAAEWRAELRRLEIGLKELEEQCCPPDEALLREKVWEPIARAAHRTE